MLANFILWQGWHPLICLIQATSTCRSSYNFACHLLLAWNLAFRAILLNNFTFLEVSLKIFQFFLTFSSQTFYLYLQHANLFHMLLAELNFLILLRFDHLLPFSFFLIYFFLDQNNLLFYFLIDLPQQHIFLGNSEEFIFKVRF